jgi:hypothetical protein
MKPETLLRSALVVACISAGTTVVSSQELPRTPSGRPDLSGTYDIANLTPFEREAKFGDRLVLTDEEAKAIEQQRAGFLTFANRQSDPNREAPPQGGDGSGGASGKVGGYNAFWIDAGSRPLPIDGQYRTSILTDPANGRLPELTPEGKKRRDAINPYITENTGDAWWLDTGDDPYDGPESLTTVDRCLYVGVATIPARSVPYNNLKRIVQTDDHVMIEVEWMHWVRVIRLDSEHAPPEILSMSGDSIGRWEGDTLVVETTNFMERPNVPRPGLRITERFSLQDPETLLYEFTVHDPEYVAPYSGAMPWPRTPDRLFEYACHEGNYAMGNILRGARLLEKEKMEGTKSSSEE